jgi:hypothetical protein
VRALLLGRNPRARATADQVPDLLIASANCASVHVRRAVMLEPTSGADPDHPPYKDEATAVCVGRFTIRGHAYHATNDHCQFGKTAQSEELSGRGVLGGNRTRNIWHLEPASLPCWSTSTRSLCQVSYRGVAGDPGLEPRPAGSEPAVLPDYTSLHRYGRCDSNAHWTGFEPAVCCHWTTPACAARGSNPVSLD